MRRGLLALGLLMVVSGLPAAPLYLERVEQAEPDAGAVAEAREQIEDHQEVTVIEELPLPPFHRRRPIPSTRKQPFCLRCHPPLPHRRDERARTFLNMHSRFVSCETCHMRPDGVKLAYRWLAYDGRDAGSPLQPGTAVLREGEEERKGSIVPRQGAHIAPFHAGEVALILGDHPFAEGVMERWENGSVAERALLKARLHAPLEKEGPECGACHGERPMLDFGALGATPEQRRLLRQNAIVRFFERFDDENERLRIDELLRRKFP